VPADSLQFVVPPETAGLRLDQALAALVPQQSRSQLQRLIKDGRVLVDGTAATRVSTPVKAGARISLDVPAPSSHDVPVPQALALDIVYEDPDVAVINKAAGMVVHPAAGHTAGTLVNALLHHLTDLQGIGGELRPGIVHRLDKGTSGLMVVAKHEQALRHLTAQFSGRSVTKEYAALVWGVVQPGRRIEDAIGRDPSNRKRMSTRARRARTAVTRVTWAEHFPGVSLIHVAIATGRTHQIRVHLSAIGHAIVGDTLYGGTRRRVAPHLKAVAGLTRPFLHARMLGFAHPRDERPLLFEAPLATDLQQVLDHLRADILRLKPHAT
jgi:23S rRNA pseudouridine1911/1915/1917 synthase